ncbi:MAG TPA: hypothetical protein PLE92_12695, partial [Lentisphaeria bacterium]|nr:hypothetical protein [Lentisphaeria bacterium]
FPIAEEPYVKPERTNDTLLLLRLSPLSSVKVVTGKMKAALLYVLIFLLSSLPVFLVLVYLESPTTPNVAAMIPKGLDLDSLAAAGGAIRDCAKTYWRVGAWVGILITTCLALTSGGLCASCFSPNTGVATAVSYGFALAVAAGSLSVLLFSTRTSPDLQAIFLMFNPFVAAMEITLDNSLASRLPAVWGNRLWVNHLIIFSGLTALLVAVSAIRVHILFREQK